MAETLMTHEAKNDSLLKVKDLSVSFATDEVEVQALDAVDFEVKQGQTLGLEVKSGGVKSVTGLSVLRLLPRPMG